MTLRTGSVSAFSLVSFCLTDLALGKDIYACTDVITVKEMAEQLSAVSGKTVKSNGLSVEVFKSEDFQGKIGKELWDNMDLFYRR